MRLLKRSFIALVLLITTACGNIPLPILTFATAGPSPTPRPAGPTPTPLPAALVTFTLHAPSNTPPGSAPAVKIIDEVGGTSIIVPLLSAGNNVWTGGTKATVGAVLRYRYIRALPTYEEEVTPARQSVPYRLLQITANTETTDDVVAAWTDTPFVGDLGGVSGFARNSNTGQGVMGVLVAAGGKIALTAGDGSYVIADLPVGTQRVNLLSPDGFLAPMQRSVTVAAGQIAAQDFATPDPNQVHVTFMVRLPPGTDGSATLRLAGDIAGLGDTFTLSPNGSAIASARQPVLIPLADGRWAAIVVLPVGAVISYKYTLGDGVWNGELDSSGSQRLRHIVIPFNDTTIEDTVDAWHSGSSASVTFAVTTPGNTPPNDLVTIQFRAKQWDAPLPMWRASTNEWKYTLYNPTDIAGSVFYRFCRNYACSTADDSATAGRAATGRFFTFTLLPQNIQDRIDAWQWLADAPPTTGVLPAINNHLNFSAGLAFDDSFDPNSYPFFGDDFKSAQMTGAGWVAFTPRGTALSMNPRPQYSLDPALSLLPYDWKTLVDQAHNTNLRVVLHPVTCHYTPYGACEYWNGLNYNTDFWNLWFAAYQQYILTQADLATRANVDLLVIGDFKLRPALPGEPEAPPDADTRWRSLISNVRAHYKGPLAFELLMGSSVWPNPPQFLDSVDVIRLFWWSALSQSNSASIADMANTAGALMDAQVAPVFQRFNKPIHLVTAYYSADGVATQCLKRDDGQCRSYEDFNPGGPDTPYALDLQEQADIYTALLTAVNARPWVGGFFAYGYNPMATLRDKSLNIRGKPAEAVLSAWYPKLQGK
jgi:hypothetical protein